MSYLLGILLPIAVISVIVYMIIYATKTKKGDSVSVPDTLLWTIGVSVVGLNLFAFDTQFGLGMGLFLMTVIISIALCIGPKKRTLFHSIIATTGCLASILFAWRANEFVQNVNLFVALSSIVLLLLLNNIDSFHWYGSWICKTVWQYILRSIRQVPLAIKTLFTVKNKKHPGLFTAIKTLLITLFLLIVFGSLLSQADPIFAEILDDVFEQLAERTVLSLLLTLGLTVALSSKFKTLKPQKPQIRFLSFTETLLPIVAVTILFAVFLFVQAKYLYGDHGDFRNLDITYSEYVRKGFMELLVATFFGGIVSYIVSLKKRATDKSKEATSLLVINFVLLLELYLLLASALKRDFMYVEMYGLTRVRIIGGLFLGWLAVILLLLVAFNGIKKMQEKQLLATGGIFSIVVFLLLNIMNIDQQIARAVPPRNEPRDYFYINALSTDAIQGWKSSIGHALETYESLRSNQAPNDDQKKKLADAKLSMLLLEQERQKLIERFEKNSKWQNYNMSKQQAFIQMHKDWTAYSNTVSCIIREIADYQMENDVELYEQERQRLYEYTYPFVDVRLHQYYPEEVQYLTESLKWEHQRGITKRGYNKKAESCRITFAI